MKTSRFPLSSIAACVGILSLAGCGSGSSGSERPPSTARFLSVRVTAAPEVPTLEGHAAPPAADPRPLEAATWQIVGTDLAGSTDEDGSFTLTAPPDGLQTLAVLKTVHGRLIDVELPILIGDEASTEIRVFVQTDDAHAVSRAPYRGADWELTTSSSGAAFAHAPDRPGQLHVPGTPVRIDSDGNGTFSFCTTGPLPVLSPETSEPCPERSLTRIDIGTDGPVEIGVDRSRRLSARGLFANGSSVDLSAVAAWLADPPGVVAIDDAGGMRGMAPGTASVSAWLGAAKSRPTTVSVVDTAPVRLDVFFRDCFFPLPVLDFADAPIPPSCGGAMVVGDRAGLVAQVVFEDGAVEDVTTEVAWSVEPAGLAEIDTTGTLTALAAGNGTVRATYRHLESASLAVTIFAEATLVSIEIYPEWRGGLGIPEPVPFGDVPAGLPLLLGEELSFRAIGYYDTGLWADVTAEVEWASSNPTVATADPGGLVRAVGVGDADITARLGTLVSAPFPVFVVERASVVFLNIQTDEQTRVVERGGILFLRAFASYDIGIYREVTNEVTWNVSDPRVGVVGADGAFTGLEIGVTTVSATLEGVESNALEIEVFARSDITFCDPANVNRSVWSDGANRVILETDCAEYAPGELVTIRYTVEELEPRFGIFDPCLDLFVQRDSEIVRVIREEGCAEFGAAAAPELDAEVIFQLEAFWDQRDAGGALVDPGIFTIFARFFLYYDPIVTLDVEVTGRPENSQSP